MSRVDVTSVTKRYGAVAALDNVTVSFEEGGFFGLLGPSGSGKTTLLRAIAGFIVPDTGSIAFDGNRIETVAVHRRNIGMVFQSYALFPHMTVEDNVAFGLTVRGEASEQVHARVDGMLSLVRLSGLGNRKPRELSGGQQQRVALARALITQPKVLLLDEPLGALDRRLRQEMQVELKDIQRKSGVTTIFVTHDQEEALTLSDRVAIINEGRIAQIGSPQEVYEKPTTVFAAQFLGDANVLHGKPRGNGLVLSDGTAIATNGPCSGTAIVRPEKLTVDQGAAQAKGNALRGHVLQSIYSGASVTYRVAVSSPQSSPLLAFMQNRTGEILAPGTAVTVSWDAASTIPVRVEA